MKKPTVLVRKMKEEELPLQIALHLLEKPKTPQPSLLLEGEEEGCSLRLYQKKDGTYTLVFQGKRAEEEYHRSFPNESLPLPKNKKPTLEASLPPSLFPQIGSDEVGTGDVFGPLIVVGAYLKKENLPTLHSFAIRDSKKVSDEEIRQMFPLLKKEFPHKVAILSPSRYNEIRDRYNMNAMKAVLHNYVHLHLQKAFSPSYHYIDQFCSPDKYFSYLSKGKEQIFSNVFFAVKGESHYPSVALASCLARGYFLEEIQKMNEKYNVKFPLGASSVVDEFIEEFAKKYGEEEFKQVAKCNFKNFSREEAIKH